MSSGCNRSGFFDTHLLGMLLVFILIIFIFPLFFVGTGEN